MRGTELLPPGRGSIVAISAPGVRMHGQERWSMLLLCLGLLAPALLPAAQKQEQDKTTLPARTPSRERRFFATTAQRVTELMDEGMDQHQLH